MTNRLKNPNIPSHHNVMLPVTLHYLRRREKELTAKYEADLADTGDRRDGEPSADSIQAGLRVDLTNGAALLANIRARLIDPIELTPPTQNEVVEIGHMVLVDWGADKEWVHILGEGDASYAGFVCEGCTIISSSSAFGEAALGKRPGDDIEWTTPDKRTFRVRIADSELDEQGNAIGTIYFSNLFNVEIPEE